jgi:small-conductance mechanosensitive channel/predicted HTH domain antitoxin
VIFFNILSLPAFSENTPDKDPGQQTYPVMLGDHVLFEIPEIAKDINQKNRAELISERLTNMADDPLVSFDDISIVDYKEPISVVLAKKELLFGILTEDAEYAGITRQELAQELSEKLKIIVSQYRKERQTREIIKGAVMFIIETLLLFAVLFFIHRLYRKAIKRMNDWVTVKKEYLESQSLDIVRIDKVSFLILMMVKTIWLIIVFGVLYFYIQVGLSFFPWTQAIGNKLLGFVLLPLTIIIKSFWDQVPNLFFLVIISVITAYLLKLLRLFFNGIEVREIKFKNFYPEWAQPTHGVCRVLIIAFALVVAFPYIPGSNSLAFKGISLFFGVLFSLGSSTAIANILAGYMIIYRRVFSVGDRIKINDIIGDVIETRLQVIHLRTLKNEDLSVPNSLVVNSQVLNYTSLANKHGLILHTTVSIGYDIPWRQVHAMLLEAADRIDGIMKNPAPFILQKSLDDFYIVYELNVYTNDPRKMGKIYSTLHQHILDVFNENNVQIMSPHYINDKPAPVIVPKAHWFTPPAEAPVTD